jgi:hypothetical protein
MGGRTAAGEDAASGAPDVPGGGVQCHSLCSREPTEAIVIGRAERWSVGARLFSQPSSGPPSLV